MAASADAHPRGQLADDVQRVGGGFVPRSPTVGAQLRAAKQRVLELWAQLEQRTRQLSAMHAQLTAVTSAHHTSSVQNDQLGRRLAACLAESERTALQMTQLQQLHERTSEDQRQLRARLAEQQQETVRELPQVRAAVAELTALRSEVVELRADASHSTAAQSDCLEECGALRHALQARTNPEHVSFGRTKQDAHMPGGTHIDPPAAAKARPTRPTGADRPPHHTPGGEV